MIPLGVLGSSKLNGATFPTPGFHIDAGNASSYPGTGTTWTDISPNAYPGTFIGSPTYQAAVAGGAMQFTPNSAIDFGSLSSGPTNLSGGQFTVSLWVYPLASTEGAFLEKGYASGWMLWYYQNSVRFYRAGSLVTQQTIATNAWQHLVYTFDSSGSSSLKMYLNNVLMSTTAMASPVNTAANLYVGKYATLYINGRITEARIWTTAFNATAVGDLFTATRARHGI